MKSPSTFSHANPFAMIVHPAQVLSAMEGSSQLRGLRLRRLRPLDQAWLARTSLPSPSRAVEPSEERVNDWPLLDVPCDTGSVTAEKDFGKEPTRWPTLV